MSSVARLRTLLVVLLVLAGSLAGCASLPESGEVRRSPADLPDRPQDAPYFSPPGPSADGSPESIVSGFLVAMQANPLSTSIARGFLSERAKATWQPQRGTIVYDAYSVEPVRSGVTVRMADTQRLDARGGWRAGPPAGSESLDLSLVSENGQWRIDNPVNALVVPTSFFDRSFARFNLYFFDQTGKTLLPDPVFIPRGEQTATNLVRGLLAGPGEALGDISRSALPSRTGLDLSVVVTESGVAEVPLSRELLRASPAELSRAVDQLAWTLRQVPGIERVRITVDGAPVPLPGGRVDASVTSGPEYDAAGPSRAQLWALRGNRVVDLSPDSKGSAGVGGPFGRPGFSMRSFAVSEPPQRIAAVSGSGSSVYVAGTEGGTKGSAVSSPLVRGTDVLRPSFDMFGDLWLVDRTPRGARVYLVSEGRVRPLRVPGVTGANVAAFSVARDGSRMAVAYAGLPAPQVRVIDILRTDEGIVSGAGDTRSLTAKVPENARILDLGWRDPGTLAVLSRPSAETSQVSFLSTDGSPTNRDLIEPNVFRGAAQAMVVSPDENVPLRLVTPDQRLYTLSENGSWPRTSSKVAAAAYAP